MRKQLSSAILFFFAAVVACNGQATTEKLLFDEFSRVTCDEQRGRLDAFLLSLAGDPNSVGRVIIYGQHDLPLLNFRLRDTVAGHMKLRNFDAKRMEFYVGQERDEFKIELGKFPLGSDEPKLPVMDWKVNSPLGKPTLYYNFREEAYCPASEIAEESFFRILAENRELTGRIVIHEKSSRAYARERSRLTKQMYAGFPKRRLQFWRSKSRESYAELWLEPTLTGIQNVDY